VDAGNGGEAMDPDRRFIGTGIADPVSHECQHQDDADHDKGAQAFRFAERVAEPHECERKQWRESGLHVIVIRLNIRDIK